MSFTRWAIVGVVGASIFMGTFASTVVTLVLPEIASSFHVVAVGGAEWVLLSFLLALAALQLIAGRLADIFGRKPVLLTGLAIFSVTSGLCGLAPSLPLLVAFRVLQGCGSALVLALAMALLADAFPPSELGRAMAWNSVLVGIGTGSGPALGGLIAQHLGWRWVFLLSVPLGLVAAAISARVLPPAGERQQVNLDVRGATLLAAGLAALTLGISFGGRWGWTSPLFLGDILVAGLALVLAIQVERHAPQPVLDPALFRNRTFAVSSISYGVSFVCLFAALLLVPLYLAQARGLDAQTAGLLITPLLAMMVLAAPLARGLSERFSPGAVSTCGMALVATGLGLLSFCSAATAEWLVLLATFVAGLGLGLFYPSNNYSYMASAPAGRRGVVSAFMATLRTVGGGLGAALTTATFAALAGARPPASLPSESHAQTPWPPSSMPFR